MPTINLKRELLEQLALIGKALGNAHRLELLEFLAQGERSVESLATLSGMTVANTSQHLRQLRQAGLVTTRKSGVFVFNQLADEAVIDLLASMRTVAENGLSQLDLLIKTYLLARDSFEPISANDLLKRVHENSVTVLDVRPTEEFISGHLPGAVNIPLNQLEERLAELPNDLEVVAYCRGPYCVLSFDAVTKLRDTGYRARRLEDGFPEWKRSGLPVESARPL